MRAQFGGLALLTLVAIPVVEAQVADRSAPLYAQADELMYAANARQVILRGAVEIYYNDYILIGDEVTYDAASNTLVAIGQVALKDPSGTIVRGERLQAADDMRDAFAAALPTDRVWAGTR